MLLINGIDPQTGGHGEAARHMWSGVQADNNTPSIAALFAARHMPGYDVPTPFISTGGFSRTGDLLSLTRLANTQTLESIAVHEHERGITNQARYVEDFALEEIYAARSERHALTRPDQLPRFRAQRAALLREQENTPLLRRYREYLPGSLNTSNPWVAQTSTALACMRAGITASASVYVSDFDTHSDHENLHAVKLQELLETITFAIDRADELGLLDRMTVIISSEFSRTPEYGTNGGKDHWPTNSMFLMGPGIVGNRVIGATDDGLVPRNLNLDTLQVDDAGERLYPGHIHAALREHLDLTDFATQAGFDLRMRSVPLFAG
jgi:hypothetical protein